MFFGCLFLLYLIQLLIYFAISAKIKENMGELGDDKLMVLLRFVQQNSTYAKYFVMAMAFQFTYFFQKELFRNYLVYGFSRKQLHQFQFMLVLAMSVVVLVLLYILLWCVGKYYSIELSQLMLYRESLLNFGRQVLFFNALGLLGLGFVNSIRSYIALILFYAYCQLEETAGYYNGKWKSMILDYLPLKSFSDVLRSDITLVQCTAFVLLAILLFYTNRLVIRKLKF